MDVTKTERFRANVRVYCRRLGVTQRVLANRADVSEQYLSKMLAGGANPTLALCERIAAALDVPLEGLLATPPEPTNTVSCADRVA
jgi:transcriptional regulator with XRE-family HTH domain